MRPAEPAPFGSLYYTDCLPGQGLSGGAGFGFQARSAGLDEGVQRVVQRAALYEVPTRWLRDHRPVEEYPPSLAHLRDGPFVTAAGRYLGREANGPRDGNQFTHAVVTDDPGSYGLVRPAQLWGAPWWAGEPAPTTTCPPVPAAPAPGPWDTEVVRSAVAGAPGGRERLLALVSALGALRGPQRRRVVLVTGEGGDAACWLAAATLLLDRARALDISFKIFATDPDRSPHDVLVVHPDWAGPHGRHDGYLVLDLTTGEVPDVPTSDEAAFWVPLFLDADDPLDVVDAVELAGQLAHEHGGAGAHPVPGEVERRAAALAGGLDVAADPPAVARIAQWLAGATASAVDLVGAPLVDALLTGATEHPTLVALDAVAARRAAAAGAGELGWDAVAVTARRRLFAREVELSAERGKVPGEGRLLPVAGPGEPGVDDALAGVAGRADPAVAVALGERHGHRPAPDLLEQLATWWADRPGSGPDPTGWVAGEAAVGALTRELDRRLADPAQHERTDADVTGHWWCRPTELWRGIPVLGPLRGAPGVRPLDVAVARGAFAAGGEPARVALAAVGALAAPSTPSRDPWSAAWRVALGTAPVSTRTVRRFLEVVPAASVGAPLARVAYHSLVAAPGYDADAEAAHAVLERAGHTPAGSGHAAWPPTDPAVVEVVDRLGAGVGVDEAESVGHVLGRAARTTREDRIALLRAVLAAGPAVGGRVLRHAGPTPLREQTLVPLLKAVAEGAQDTVPDARAAAVLFVMAVQSYAVHPREGRRRRAALEPLVRGLGEAGRREVTAVLAEDPARPAADGVLEAWRQWLAKELKVSGAALPADPAPPGGPAHPGDPGPSGAAPPAASSPTAPTPRDPAPSRRGRFGLRKRG